MWTLLEEVPGLWAAEKPSAARRERVA